MKKVNDVKKTNEALVFSEEEMLDIENLMRVEGGTDNEEWLLLTICQLGVIPHCYLCT